MAEPIEKSQLDKFREAARKLETDDDEGRFNEKLKRVATTKSAKEVEKSDK